MSAVPELAPVESMNDRFPTVRVRQNDHEFHGQRGTFAVEGYVTGTRLMVLGDRTVVTVAVGAGEVTLQVPSEDVEVIS